MNMDAAKISAFSTLSASLSGRNEVKTSDVFVALYVLHAEYLYQYFGDAEVVDDLIGQLCDFNEPLWMMRMNFYESIFRGANNNIAKTFYGDMLNVINNVNDKYKWKTWQDLLDILRQMDVRIAAALTDTKVRGPENSA